MDLPLEVRMAELALGAADTDKMLKTYTSGSLQAPGTADQGPWHGFAVFRETARRAIETESFRAQLSSYQGPWDLGGTTAMLARFFRGRCRSDPGGAMPGAGTADAAASWTGTLLALQHLVRRFVTVEGAQVLSFLGDQDKRAAKALPGVLRTIVEQRQEGAYGSRVRRTMLHKALRTRGVTDGEWEWLMDCPATAKRRDRFERYPGHADLSVAATAGRLHDFLRTWSNWGVHEQRLLEEFREWGVAFHSDSRFRDIHLSGQEDADMVEVAAVMSLTSCFFRGAGPFGRAAWRDLDLRREVMDGLCSKVFEHGLSWREAKVAACQHVDRVKFSTIRIPVIL